ncbi:MAG: carbohydrate-binding family 9-like protein [Reichenbachiella sp.]|uniref:carbohydrate-binding family 9-like protein n=1 Tax=Reichenbachiella sp. TaxID=2184521 RepID=UPI003267C932
MTNISHFLSLLILALAISHTGIAQTPAPEQYSCRSTASPLVIDGILDEASWAKAEWTNEFVDIEGDKKPKPTYRTRVKMLWDEQYFYIAAEMEEPHLWATYDQRDMVIFHENDFEVFIDPDGDTHQYYELEINALGTVWDLMLIKPYRDGGPAIDAWDIAGLKKGVKLNGTLNNPNDTDKGWTIELAMPWEILREAARESRKPVAGDVWRVNFSRVNWKTEKIDGTYAKRINPETGKPFPESNWVWSPQGVIAMHQPETWGYVTFMNEGQVIRNDDLQQNENCKWKLREVYFAQREFFEKNGTYSNQADQLGVDKNVALSITPSMFEATIDLGQYTWHIDHQGRTWKTAISKK